ncbi:MAG: cysteine desulfurase [Patescibacteria group bacterium]|nr:cysteine desulfurase [Patescibacteria group bacterium]
MSKRIYLDHASLTPIDPRVTRAMGRYASPSYANPSSIYAEGAAARRALEEGRKAVAGFLGARPGEVVFTGSGTEANALALEGAVRAAIRARSKAPHIVISSVEHSSVREAAAALERDGCRVDRLPVGADGAVSAAAAGHAIGPDTVIVSVMAVNNETGAIQPVRDIAKAVKKARAASGGPYPLFHTDAAQAVLYEDIGVERLGADLLTLDGGKACGPRGIGALYVRSCVPLEPVIRGGGQEHGVRSGTENLPAIMGLAEALRLGAACREAERARVASLKEAFLAGLMEIRPDASVNGPAAGSSGLSAPHILNVSIPGIDNEFLVLQLDARGIACSTKSSCLRDQDDSYVLAAMGADGRSSVRFSFGRTTRPRDVRKALAALRALLRPER